MATTGIPLKGVVVPATAVLPVIDWANEIAKIPGLLGLWVADEDYLVRNAAGGVTAILPSAGSLSTGPMGPGTAKTAQSTWLGDQMFTFAAADLAIYGKVPLTNVSQFTIAQVFRVETADAADDYLFKAAGAANAQEIFARLTSAGGHFIGGAAGIPAIGMGNNKVDLTRWNTIISRVNGSGGATFLNGAKAVEAAPGTPPAAIPGAVSVWGRPDANDALQRPFAGYSPLWAIWDRPVTDAEAATIYAAVKGMHPSAQGTL